MLPPDNIEKCRLSGIRWADDCPMWLLYVFYSCGRKVPCQPREHGMI